MDGTRGKHGEQEDLALEEGIAVIGWDELPDLSKFETQDELEKILRQTYPEVADGAIYQWRSQLWRFSHVIKEGDLIVLPLKTRSALAVGRVRGPYEHRPELDGATHTRLVNWIRDDLPRTAIDQDLLYSLGASQTVCRISRNQAEDRFEALLKGEVVPPSGPSGSLEEESTDTDVDLEQVAQDRIQAFITRKFAGHDLTRLVAALLEAQGYKTVQSPAGPDGGVDVIAGKGLMGFDSPRMCVQVKSGSSPVDVKIFRELKGVLSDFGADQGLLVSWGGFNQSVYKEARKFFFQVRLWDAGKLVQLLQEHYDELSDEIQAELPLKRIWMLVLER